MKKELKAAVKAYVLRQTSLDNMLAETMKVRDFDWDMDMRRMMDAVKVTKPPMREYFFWGAKF